MKNLGNSIKKMSIRYDARACDVRSLCLGHKFEFLILRTKSDSGLLGDGEIIEVELEIEGILYEP